MLNTTAKFWLRFPNPSNSTPLPENVYRRSWVRLRVQPFFRLPSSGEGLRVKGGEVKALNLFQSVRVFLPAMNWWSLMSSVSTTPHP